MAEYQINTIMVNRFPTDEEKETDKKLVDANVETSFSAMSTQAIRKICLRSAECGADVEWDPNSTDDRERLIISCSMDKCPTLSSQEGPKVALTAIDNQYAEVGRLCRNIINAQNELWIAGGLGSPEEQPQ